MIFLNQLLMLTWKELYDRFEEHLVPYGHVLDAGCGSGRDTKYFLE